jgi:hypothetical protein
MNHLEKLGVIIACMTIILSTFIFPAYALLSIKQAGSAITITHLVQLSRFVVVMGTWTSDTISCKPIVNPIGSMTHPCSLLSTSAYGGKVIVEWSDGNIAISKIVPNNSQASYGNWLPVQHFYNMPSNAKPYSTHYTIVAKLIGLNNELLASTSHEVII